jgi:hypothetical protein
MRYLGYTILACIAWLVPTQADAQARASLDYFVSHQQLAVAPGDRQNLDGVGGRIMWPLALLPGGAYHPLLSRTSLGVYVLRAGEGDEHKGVWDYGAQTDVRLARGLFAGWVAPVVSVAVGTIRQEVPGMQLISTPYVVLPEGWMAGDTPPVLRIPSLEATLPPRTERRLTAKPGVGARIYLSPSVDLRADIYRPIDLRQGSVRGLELSGGISLRA